MEKVGMIWLMEVIIKANGVKTKSMELGNCFLKTGKYNIKVSGEMIFIMDGELYTQKHLIG